MSGDIPNEIPKGADRVDENRLHDEVLEARKDLQSKVTDKAVVGDVLLASAPKSIEEHNMQASSRFFELVRRLPENVLKEFIDNQRAGMKDMDADSRLALEHNLELLRNA